MDATLLAQGQALIEAWLASEEEAGYPQPVGRLVEQCARILPASRFAALANGLHRQCEAAYKARQGQLQSQQASMAQSVKVLVLRARKGDIQPGQQQVQCAQAATQAMLPARQAEAAVQACRQALDEAFGVVQAAQQERFDKAREGVQALLPTITPQSDVAAVCDKALQSLGTTQPRAAEFRQHCVQVLGLRLAQVQMGGAGGGGGDAGGGTCGQLNPAGQAAQGEPGAVSCLVRRFARHPDCVGDQCRVGLQVGKQSLWIHPPVLGDEVVLVPDSGQLLRLANKVQIDVSVRRGGKLDLQLRMVTVGGRLGEVVVKSIDRSETAAAVGMTIGESVLVLAAGLVPLPGVGESAGALVPILDKIANHYMAEHFDRKRQEAMVSDEASAAAAAASALAAVYNTLYHHAAGRTNFVTHVCLEAGSTGGSYTGFLKGRKGAPELAADRRCQDEERWELWSLQRKDGTLVDGDVVYLRSHKGEWLTADPGGAPEVRLRGGALPAGAASAAMQWRVVSGDGRQIIGNIAVPGGLVDRPDRVIGREDCLYPLRPNQCMVPIRLQSMLRGKWLDAGPDNQHAGAAMGAFTKTRARLTDQPDVAATDAPWRGHLAVHRWFGAQACTQGERVRDLNCLPGTQKTNLTYLSGY